MKLKEMFLKIFVIFIFSSTVIFSSYATTEEELKKERQELERQIKETESEIKKNNVKVGEYEEQVNKELLELNKIESTIANQTSDIEDLEIKLKDINQKVSTLEHDLQNAAQKYNSAQELYQTRVKIMYEKGIPSMIELFLSSKDMTEFFSKLNVLNGILEHDKNLMNNMKSQKEYTDYIKKDIENQKINLEQLKYDKEKTAEALELSKKNREVKVSQLNSSKAKTLVANQQLLKEKQQKQEAERAIDSEIKRREAAAGNVVFGGAFRWPVNTVRISAGYGYYTVRGKTMMHWGVDNTGPDGTVIYAAADGTVTKAWNGISDQYGPFPDTLKYSYDSKNGLGYGNHIYIYHGKNYDNGNTYTTVYGHLYKIYVTEGQKIKQGDAIGIMGSTGYSTGRHLHFEIRENGDKINPSKFFSFLR